MPFPRCSISRTFRLGSVCPLAAIAIMGLAQGASIAPVLQRAGVAISPSFEERCCDSGRRQYSWETPGVTATLTAGAIVALHCADGVTLRMTIPGANPRAEPVGEAQVPRRTLFYWGKPLKWRVDSHFAQVRYRAIYPGIDLIFASNSGHLEYSFEVSPGADPGAIRMRFEGATFSLDRSGEVTVYRSGFKILQSNPNAFQIAGGRHSVACSYVLAGPQELRLKTGPYDRSAPLTIDPVLSFTTFIGGPGFSAIYAMATDGSGNLYIAGQTSSLSLWNGAGPVRSSSNAFLVKLNGAATQVLYTLYLGGSGSDTAKSIAVDSSGNAYVAGITSSPDFPVTAGSFSTIAPGPQNAFVAKVSPLGALQYSTYLGGATADFGDAIAIDSAGEAFVAGETESPLFPVTPGALQPAYEGGVSDCFVSKLNASGSALVYSTFLGGSGLDACSAVAVDSAGDAYVTGTTYSANFPTLGALQSLGGTASAFVSEINPTGSALVYSTFLGGTNLDQGYAIAVDSSGNTYVAGATASPDFPTTPGVFQASLGGIYNAFVSKLAPGGVSLVYSTFLGGSGSDTATSIALDNSGRVFLAGFTSSVNFPQENAPDPQFQGYFDAFASVLDPEAKTLIFSSYLGGTGDDRAYAGALGAGSSFYAAGLTSSSNFPAGDALEPVLSGSYAGFLLKISGVFDLALNQPATQSSTYAPGFSNASDAVDGNTNGSYSDGSVSTTGDDQNAWWEVDLGNTFALTSITIWNRTDCCGSRLSDYWVFVSNTPFATTDTPTTLQGRAGVFSSYQTTAPNSSSNIIIPGAQGRFVRIQLSATNYLSLAEVQVYGSAVQDLALHQPATQSSTYAPGFSNASNAVDGDTDGTYSDGSVTTTLDDTNAWWQVDLGTSPSISEIVIWNRTDCCGSRLTDYWVFVSDIPFAATDTPATLQNRADTFSSYQTAQPNPASSIVIPGAKGRYVRVQLAGTNYLSLAEVQVYGTAPVDLALNQPATQSSTLVPGFSNASDAVDGDTDGSYYDGSLSTTMDNPNAWWEVDLGASFPIGPIVVWNRTDCCGSRLTDYWVFVSNTPFAATDTPSTLQNESGVFSSYQTLAPDPSATIIIPGAQGRYVRVQLAGTNYLSLAEVQVFSHYP